MTLLEAALAWRDLLADTWVGKAPNMKKGEHCLSTAGFVVAHDALKLDQRSDFQRLARQYFEERGIYVAKTFNDAPGRTKQEVLDLVDDFIRWLKERKG